MLHRPKARRATGGAHPYRRATTVPRTLKPKLKLQEVVPDFDLPSTKNGKVGLWSYKQKLNMVLLFFHGRDCKGCIDLLQELARDYARYQDDEAEILAVTTMPLDEARALADQLHLPFPILSDPTGKTVERFTYLDEATGGPVPSLFVLDRFGAVYTQAIAEREDQLPSSDEVLEWLGLIEAQCPECGAPEWPSLNV
jgi:peroxiredoxin